jgi:hypothetical protein
MRIEKIILQVTDAIGQMSRGLDVAQDNVKALQSINHLLLGFLIVMLAALIVVYLRGEKKDRILLEKEKADNELRLREIDQRTEESKLISGLINQIAVLVAKIDQLIFSERRLSKTNFCLNIFNKI